MEDEMMIEIETDSRAMERLATGKVVNTLASKLSQKKKRLEDELAKVNEAIDIVSRNPDVIKVLDTLSSISGLGRL